MYALKQCRDRLLAFVRDDTGPTATEYAVMLALIIVVALISIGTLGRTVNSMYEDNTDRIAQAVSGG